MAKYVAASVMLIMLAMNQKAIAVEMAGSWKNVDEKTEGLTRIEIYQTDSSWVIRIWAYKGETEIDLGQTTLAVLGDSVTCPNCIDSSEPTISPTLLTALGEPTMSYGFAKWDYKFKETYLTLRLNENRLVIEEYNLFKEGDGRTNYRDRGEFKRINSPENINTPNP